MRKTSIALLACLLTLLLTFSASAEQVTLTYSYGAEASNKHMLDVANTVEYGGKTYTFDFGGLEFSGAFNMYGGNVRTVFECEVPRAQMAIHGEGEELYLGQVIINPPSPMTLYVFSGDRVSGQYTLMDTQTTGRYILDISAARDEAGNLRLVDKVFLYSYEQDGKEMNYAASLYISYEGVAASPAEGAPAKAAADTAKETTPVPENMEGELATYVSMMRILEEERTKLCVQLAEKDAEIARLAGEVDRLAQQNGELSTANDTLQAQVNNAVGADEAAALRARIVELEAANAALQAEAQRAADLNNQVAQLEKEVIALRAGDTSLSAATPTPTPTVIPTATPVMTAPPTSEPTATPAPTAAPTAVPTAEPTPAPTAPPTPEPTATPMPAPVAQAAEATITFQERPWGSSADEIAQWLLDAGIVTNQYSLLSGGHAWLQPCYYSYVFLNGDGSVPEQNSHLSATKMLWANEFLSPEFSVAGYAVENLYFAFAAQGDTTRLIGVAIDFKCPEGEEAAFADVQQKLRDTYGPGNADDESRYLRFGADNTALHLFRRPYDGLILTYGDTTAVATLESMTK